MGIDALLLAALSASPEALEQVDVVEKLGQRVPLGLGFTDSDGRAVALGEAFVDGRPVVLSFVYYRCPTLCELVTSGLSGALRQTGYRLGEDYAAVTVSVDASEPPSLAEEKKREQLRILGAGEPSAWLFLTGEEASIRALAEAVGFRDGYDEGARQFAHAAAVVVLTPEGKVSRYLYGVRYPPRDVRLALLEAAGGRVGTAFDRFLMKCYRFDPATRRYELYVKGFLRGGALAVFFALFGALSVYWRRELKQGHGRRA